MSELSISTLLMVSYILEIEMVFLEGSVGMFLRIPVKIEDMKSVKI